jgi:hypothetical protein
MMMRRRPLTKTSLRLKPLLRTLDKTQHPSTPKLKIS